MQQGVLYQKVALLYARPVVSKAALQVVLSKTVLGVEAPACGEADVGGSPDQSEERESEAADTGNLDHKLLVCEEVLLGVSEHCALHKGIPWLREDL